MNHQSHVDRTRARKTNLTVIKTVNRNKLDVTVRTNNNEDTSNVDHKYLQSVVRPAWCTDTEAVAIRRHSVKLRRTRALRSTTLLRLSRARRWRHTAGLSRRVLAYIFASSRRRSRFISRLAARFNSRARIKTQKRVLPSARASIGDCRVTRPTLWPRQSASLIGRRRAGALERPLLSTGGWFGLQM